MPRMIQHPRTLATLILGCVLAIGPGVPALAEAQQETASDPVLLVSRPHPDLSYYLYVPPSYDGSRAFRLMVSVHGTSRRARLFARHFVQFANDYDYVVLAPLFGRTVEPDEDYQRLGVGTNQRADLDLLDIVNEVAARYRLDTDQFDLFGFSGGGQFAHRFLYIHPERLRSVVAAAPGTITPPTDEEPWPAGIASLAELAGVSFDLAAIQRCRVMLIIGTDDTASRLRHARALHASWLAAGIAHDYVEVPAVAHLTAPSLMDVVREFMAGS